MEECAPNQFQLFLLIKSFTVLSQFWILLWKSGKSQVIPYVVTYLFIMVGVGSSQVAFHKYPSEVLLVG